MKHLSGLDASFLHLETPEMPMHVGSLFLLDLPLAQHAGFHDVIRRHLSERLHLAGVFSQKLAHLPFDIANPVWIADDAIDLDYHIRQVSLPLPGTRAQLEAYVGRLHSSLLDRSRPLWECYVLTGLDSGQLGLYLKLHHAALEGQGAASPARVLCDDAATPRRVEPPQRRRSPPPAASSLLGAALRDTFTWSLRLAKGMPAAIKLAAAQPVPRFAPAPRTPLNASITNQRSFATVTLSRKEVLEVGKAFGASLDDVILTIVSGALRRYFDAQDALPEQSLVAAVPVSLAESGNAGAQHTVPGTTAPGQAGHPAADDTAAVDTAAADAVAAGAAEGNAAPRKHTGMALVTLATGEPDLAARLQAIAAASAPMQQNAARLQAALPGELPSLGLPWLLSGLVALAGRARLADTLPPFANLVVSILPGLSRPAGPGAPAAPLFLAGARVAGSYPVAIVTHGLALNVTVQHVNGALDAGIVACRRAVPDVQHVAACMTAAHEELLAAAWKMLAQPVRHAPGKVAPLSEASAQAGLHRARKEEAA